MAKTIAEAPVEEPKPARSGDSLSARIMRATGWVLIWFGLLTVGFVIHQVYVTTWFAQQEQAELDEERLAYNEAAQEQIQTVLIDEQGNVILDEETGEPIVVEVPAPAPAPSPSGSETTEPTTDPGSGNGGTTPDSGVRSRDEGLPLIIEGKPARGSAFASLSIRSQDRLKDGWNIVEGVNLRQLRRGAGHMPWTPLPGQPGNSVISGHRTTHGAPFHDFDDLEVGERIEVETAIGVHVYEVRKVQIVKPSALWVTAPDGPARAGLENGDRGSWLTLTTCHPKFSARQRLIVFAELVDGPNHQTISRLTE